MGDQKQIDEVIHNHRLSGKFITVDGIKTFVLDKGVGEIVFCIHGIPTSSFLYRKVINTLATKGYRGICIDLPGLGLSDRPETFDYTFSNFAAFLSKAAESLNIEKFHLVVHDIGGPIGFALAAKHKQKILSLTILNTWIDVVNFKKPLPMRPFEKPVLGEAQLKMFTHLTWPVMFNTLGIENKEAVPEEEKKAYVDLLKREDDGKAFLKIMRNFDHSPEFRDLCFEAVQDISYPIQAIWGANDPGLKYDRYGEEIKKVAGLKKIEKLPCRHFLQEDCWQELSDSISAFIEKRS